MWASPLLIVMKPDSASAGAGVVVGVCTALGTAVGVGVGVAVGVVARGGDAWPNSSLPQQTGKPSERRAQVWLTPLLMAASAPKGGDAWPCWLSPQQTGEPWVLRAQV